jgi:hypothetical protein
MKPRSEKIGRVVFLSEKMDAAREMSSCCVGVEALLEADAHRVLIHSETPLLATRLRFEKAFKRLIRTG